MLHIVSFHSLYFIYHLANEYLILTREFALAGVAKIKTQPIRIREMPARSGIINLRNILHLKSPVQNDGFESTRQVDQIELIVITIEYM